MPAPIGVVSKSKDHRNRKNPRSAELAAERRAAANNTPERKMAQLRYRLNAIDEMVRAGRREYDDAVNADVLRLRMQLEALEARNG
jgi:hypothetical protein